MSNAHDELKDQLYFKTWDSERIPAITIDLHYARKLLKEYEQRGENEALEKAIDDKWKLQKGFEQLLQLYVSKIDEKNMHNEFKPLFEILKGMDIEELQININGEVYK